MKTRKLTMVAAGLVAATTLLACGDDGEDVSHQTTRQAVSQNVENIGTSISTSLAFLENSDLFKTGFDATLASEPTEAPCPVAFDENGDIIEESDCDTTMEEEVTIDTDVDQETQKLVDILETYVFTDANIESETSKSVTYRLRGDVVCADTSSSQSCGSTMDPDGNVTSDCTDESIQTGPSPECVQQVDDAEIRLYVTSPKQGDIDIDVFIGPQRHNPGRLEFHSDLLAAEADLAGIKGAANHIEMVTGDNDIDLPATMQGRIRGELAANSNTSLTAALSILTDIHVADGDYNVAMAATHPALQVTADSAAKTLDAVLNIGTVDAQFPVKETEYRTVEQADGSFTDIEETTEYDIAFHLAGLTSQTLLETATEALTVSGISLGNDTSTLDIDAKRVLEVDVNENDGRTYDLSIKEGPTGDLEWEVSPAFDLRVMMKFIEVADKLSDVDDWMLDDVLQVTLDGAAKPKLRMRDEGVEVLEGQLTVSLQNAGIVHQVTAGSCLLEIDDTIEPQTDTSSSPDPGDAVEETSTNPLDDLEVASCQLK